MLTRQLIQLAAGFAILSICIIWCPARTVADGSDVGPNCDLAAPPRNAGVIADHGIYFFMFLPRIDATYDGCQVLWTDNGSRYLVTLFKQGKPKHAVYLPDADASVRAECFYDNGTLTKGGPDCLGYDEAKHGWEGQEEIVPPEKDLRLKSDYYGAPSLQ
jgi:hypothetical protein